MKKILSLAVLLMAAMQMWAAPVDVTAARASAQRFVTDKVAGGKLMAPAARNLRLGVTIPGTSAAMPALYIFNSDAAYVIVAGDDRAQEILAYGDGSISDLESLPSGMRYWLSFYQRQLVFLQQHPDVQVDNLTMKAPARAAQSVNPLLTANWSQAAPYWNECPVFGTDTCPTGCPATSLSMVFYYWKYPKQQTPEVPSYTMPSYATTLPALPPTVFDWNNMIDNYTDGNYTPAQAAAVAHLMRYIGQIEEMDYTISGSGAYLKDIQRAVKFFEYDQNVQMLFKSDDLGLENYSDAQWATFILNELTAGRPIVYCAYDNATGSGHAFNVDGYDAADDTYHINWGWNGKGNGFFALNAFTYNGYTFGTAQQMLVGVQPPEGYQNPRLQVYPVTLEMQSYINRTATATFSLKGTNLTGDVTLALNDPDGVFSLDAATLTRDEAEAGHDITVTYSPRTVGATVAVVTCTSEGCDPVTVTINGTAPLEVYAPVMQPVDDARVTMTSFSADWTDQTPAGNVASYTLEVQAKPAYSLIAEADFSDLPQMAPTNQASHATDYLPEEWTFNGTEFNLEGGCVSLRRNSTITTAELNLTGYDKVTVEVTARAYGYYGDGSELTVSTSKQSQEMVFMYAYETKTVVLDCEAAERIVFKAGYYPMIKDIKIYAGDATQGAALRASETGGNDYRLVEGIAPADRRYTVSDLTPGGIFFYKVKAHYIDGTESDWTAPEMVALHEGGHPFAQGDVNHDGVTNISDVIMLINYILNEDGDICNTCADVNTDEVINISDVIELINIVTNN